MTHKDTSAQLGLQHKLAPWSQRNVGFRPEATVHELFRERAAAHPDRVALVCDDRQLTYAELDQRSDVLARYLISAGVRDGSVVALCCQRSLEAIIAALAILKSGGAYLPLDPDYPHARLEYLIKDAHVDVLLTSAELLAAVSGLTPHTLVIAAMLADAPHAIREGVQHAQASSLAYVMYTSGSTGQPKGVQIEHRSIVRLVGNVDYVRLGEDTCFLHAAPLGFDASTLEVWGALLNGGKVAICSDAVPTGRVVAKLITRHGITSAWLTAALFNTIVDDDPSSLRGL
ncbi:MAG: AMP-binding protein, partial [Steroidobacteraceae bacterium]